MLVIGLTGGIGTGKSTIVEHFESLGVPVIDADAITRELVEPGQEALKEITAHFGTGIINKNGELDRVLLRERVFSNTDERKILEGILHPRARNSVQQQINKLERPYCILCAPLLIESGWTDLVQRILVIDTPRELQIQRTMDRDGVTRSQVEAILDSQLDRVSRLAAADDVLVNDADRASLLKQVDALHKKYLQLAENTNQD